MQTFSGSQSAEEAKDWGVDFTSLLSGDQLLLVTWTSPSPELQIARQSQGSSVSYAFISGGVAGKSYTVRVAAQTVNGRLFEAQILLYIQPV